MIFKKKKRKRKKGLWLWPPHLAGSGVAEILRVAKTTLKPPGGGFWHLENLLGGGRIGHLLLGGHYVVSDEHIVCEQKEQSGCDTFLMNGYHNERKIWFFNILF